MSATSSRPSLAAALGFVLLLGGCMVAKKPAPVVDRSPDPGRIASAPKPAAGPPTGSAPQAPPAPATPPVRSGEAVVTPYQTAPPVAGREVTGESTRPAPAKPAETPLDAGVLTGPKAVKLPYSDAALASLQGSPVEAKASPSVPSPSEASRQGEEADAVAWSWPTKGKIVAHFNENGGPKGVQIAGELGQPVLASAGGRVVYTGSGLRGYGNLVIIKHNSTYLSAYAHNRQVLVKQGDSVTRGQRIAEMGNSDANQVMLHFEIRREGKPVDPVKFLPPS
jgi:lipoprotein NlpD